MEPIHARECVCKIGYHIDMLWIGVLGGLFCGLTATFELKRFLGKKADIYVVSDDDNFVSIPFLPWLSLRWRKADNITLSINAVLKRKGITFVHEKAFGVEAGASKVLTETKEVPFNYPVVATGPYLAFEEIPGLLPIEDTLNASLPSSRLRKRRKHGTLVEEFVIR